MKKLIFILMGCVILTGCSTTPPKAELSDLNGIVLEEITLHEVELKEIEIH